MTEHLVGTYREDDHVYRVKVEIDVKRVDSREYRTVDHETITHVDRFTVSAVIDERPARGGRWRDYSAGQCIEDVAKVTDFAPGWDAAKLKTLLRVWRDWHLNDVQSDCAHMHVAPIGSSVLGIEVGRIDSPEQNVLSHYTINRALVCPVTGYRYGHAWLVKPLDDQVIAWANMINGQED